MYFSGVSRNWGAKFPNPILHILPIEAFANTPGRSGRSSHRVGQQRIFVPISIVRQVLLVLRVLLGRSSSKRRLWNSLARLDRREGERATERG